MQRLPDLAISLSVVVLFLLPAGSGMPLSAPSAQSARTPGPAAILPASDPSLLVAAERSLRAETPGPPSTAWTAPAGPWECHGDPNRGDGACAMARYADHAPNSGSGAGWTPALPYNLSPPPQSDFDYEMTYDAADGYVLLLGAVASQYGGEGITDAWTYSGGVWTNITGTQPPANCPGSSLAFDEFDGYVVYYAASDSYYNNSCPSAGQTWTYHAGTWAEISPGTQPRTRWGAALVNDSADGYLLLFGGENETCRVWLNGSCEYYNYTDLNDTWTFLHGSWTQLHPGRSPSNRSNSGMTFDAADGYVVLFGGETLYGGINDTWTFQNGTWTNLNLGYAPPVPYPDGFTYDAADGYAVYTNAYNFSGALETTWTFSAGAWTDIRPSYGPEQRLGAEQAYDYSGGFLLFFGGEGWQPLADSWSFSAGSWTNITQAPPTALTGAALTYDPLDGVVLRFGGYTGAGANNTTWSYTSSQWTELHPRVSPPARWDAGLVTDLHDGYVLLFGGLANNGTALNDTWEFAAGTWTRLTPVTAPSPRTGMGMVYDGADGNALLYGGSPNGPSLENYNTGGYRDTWSFQAGVWTNLTALVGTPPPSEPVNPLVYDAADGYVLAFGFFPSTAVGSSADALPLTWSFVGGVWTNRTGTSGGAPPSRAESALAYDSSLSEVVMFGGLGVSYSLLNDTWAYENGTWLELFPAVVPPPQSNAVLVDDPLDQAAYLEGTPSPGNPSGAWLWVGGGLRPQIFGYTASPAEVDLGNATTFTVAASEGTTPLTYQYVGLPPECNSMNVSALGCTPSTLGSYTVQVIVTDPTGQSATAGVALRVVSRPSVSTFTMAPSPATIGNRSVLSVGVGNGTAPFTYNYTGLPPGCASQTVPALPCTPTAAGNYTVVVTVEDRFHWTTSASLPVVVQAVGGFGAPSIRSFGAAPAALVLGNSTNFTAVVTSALGPTSVAYAGLPAGCSSANVTTLPCTPTVAGAYSVTLTATDVLGNSTSVTTSLTVYPVQGGGSLAVTAFSPSRPTAAVNQTVTLHIVASGGVGVLAYAYLGLPPGCATSDTAFLACTPTATGTFRITATVSDAQDDVAKVPLTLEVVKAISGTLVLVSFAPVPASIHLGQTSVLTVNVSGGSSGRTYYYTGLTNGCVSANTPTLPCTPTAVGTYRFGVTVTDSDGDRVNATSILSVLAVEAIPGTNPTTGGGYSTSVVVIAALAGAVLFGIVGYLAGRRKPPTRKLVNPGGGL